MTEPRDVLVLTVKRDENGKRVPLLNTDDDCRALILTGDVEEDRRRLVAEGCDWAKAPEPQ